MASEKRYVIESKPASWTSPEEPLWQTVAEPTRWEEAEREWQRLNEQWGHNTYHRLVEVRRKVLRCA